MIRLSKSLKPHLKQALVKTCYNGRSMNCNARCNGKCKLLGGLEQKIMEVLWASSEPQKPAEVLGKLKGDYAYTTVMTVLKRMADKKVVIRSLKGNTYYYVATQDKDTFAKHCLDDLFERLFASYGDSVTMSFYSTAKKHKLKV